MLETEAKKKWCPFARVPQDYNVSNSDTHIPGMPIIIPRRIKDVLKEEQHD